MIALALLLAATPAKVVFTNAPGTVGTGACSGLVTLEAQDATGAAAPPSSSLTVILSGAAAWFPAAGCSSPPLDPQGDLQLSPQNASVSFHFIVPDPGSATLSATVATFSASQTWTVAASPGTPAKIAFTSAGPRLQQNACSGAIAFQIQDVNGSPATIDRRIDIDVGPSGYIEIYSDPGCTGRILSIVRSAGASPDATIYLRTGLSGRQPIEAAAPGLRAGTLFIEVDAGSGGGCSSAGGGLFAALAALAFALRRKT